MSNQTIQQGLPDDPMENISGSRFLRLSNECPPKGVIVSLEKPTVADSKFKDNAGNTKKEYQWPCTHYMPIPIEKTLSESSPGFCAALSKATGGQPYGKILQIQWVKDFSGGNPRRVWSIRILTEADIKTIFAG